MNKLSFSLGVCAFLLVACGEKVSAPKAKTTPVHVDTLVIQPQTVRLSTELPGRVSAIREAEVRPQASGIIKARLFSGGESVQAGDVLYKIDPATYQASANSAKAAFDKATADASAAKRTMGRYQTLIKQKSVSQQAYDDTVSAYEQAKAQAALTKAEFDYANILLSYTDIKAPISGIVGISMVTEGALITSEQASELTKIQQIDSVYVDMTQSSVSLFKLKKNLDRIEKSADKKAPVKIKLEDGTDYLPLGYLHSSEVSVNESTGSVTLRAIIPNPDRLLLPGMFVRAIISQPVNENYLLIPQSLVVRSLRGEPFAYVVTKDNKIIKTKLNLGVEYQTNWVVISGLKAGDQVVMNNLLKMKNDIAVIVDSQKKQTLVPTQTSSID